MQLSGGDATAALTRLPALYARIRTFVVRDLWVLDLAMLSPTRRGLLQPLRVALIALRGFFIDHNCWLRAAALTYYTLLALVPMLAFAFAFLKGLGVQNKIEPLLDKLLSVGSGDTVGPIIEFINKVEVGTLGVISLCVMVITTFWQLGNMERALNVIWNVRQGRSLIRKLADYVSLFVLGPVLLTIVLSAGNQPLVNKLLEQDIIGYAVAPLLTLLPAALMWLAFSFLYYYMPNTDVRWLPALIGGLIGSLLWQLAKLIYITFQVGMVRYELIYGAIAQIPVLMAWLQISWLVVLLGAELTFACQHVLTNPTGRFAAAANTVETSPYVKEWLASSLYFSLVQAFTAGTGLWSAVAFAQQQRVPLPLLREIVTTLVKAKLLVEAADAPAHYVPGRDPATLTPWHILHALRHSGDAETASVMERCQTPATPLMAQIEAASKQAAGSRSLSQWLSGLDAHETRQNSMVKDSS